MNEQIVNALLYDAQDDWLALAGAEGIVCEDLRIKPGTEATAIMLDAVTYLLSEHLVVVGSVVPDDGFMPWPPSDEGHVARLLQVVSEGTSEDWGYSAWFNLTHEGKLRALTIPHPPDSDFP